MEDWRVEHYKALFERESQAHEYYEKQALKYYIELTKLNRAAERLSRANRALKSRLKNQE